jgi:hypothetical protein
MPLFGANWRVPGGGSNTLLLLRSLRLLHKICTAYSTGWSLLECFREFTDLSKIDVLDHASRAAQESRVASLQMVAVDRDARLPARLALNITPFGPMAREMNSTTIAKAPQTGSQYRGPLEPNTHTASVYAAFFSFAHRARRTAAIFLRSATDIVRLRVVVLVFPVAGAGCDFCRTFAHRARCAAAILRRADADIMRLAPALPMFPAAGCDCCLALAHLARWAAAILLRADADRVRFTAAVVVFSAKPGCDSVLALAHLARWAAAILCRAAADMMRRV